MPTVLSERLFELWDRPTAVVWCEAWTHAHAHSEVLAEYWNSLSSLIFVVVGALGIRNAIKQKLPLVFFYTEAMLIVVGLGSTTFHAQRNFLGELLDELPMSALAFGYLLCCNELHWLMQPPFRLLTVGLNAGFITLGWGCYLLLHSYVAFTTTFTLQVFFMALLSLSALPELGGPWATSRRWWWHFLLAILSGKTGWEYERWLYRTGNCPTDPSDPLFWLHSIWHLMSALAHFSWIRYVASLHLYQRGDPSCGLEKAKKDK
eukprot:CAMPEP_0206439202 /NCGR_PEP_ID=MMETSP0324_2-20121206/12070_1 /ASSEMBLY_ACC=CAM_ASM_000836 /TAXON_ID=2866 /ORGANISM="Crypthecodinium cohnii, Strain Seligo" /LENGTH=261 /DNA_ID=CAMNT_0053906777 /DNA_START=146 /DNA_END=931 /DNA_ORIENTATION=+